MGRRGPPSRRRASGGDPAAGGEAHLALPQHNDGGRGFIALANSLWTTRKICMWLSDGTVVEMQTEPGHCYLANFFGVEHQVVHAADGAEAGRGHTHTHTPVSSTTLKSSILPAAPFSVIPVAPAGVGFGRGLRPAWWLAPARHIPRGQQRQNSSSRASPIWRRGSSSGRLGAPSGGAGKRCPRN